jgi:pimeloyl-ACP methyl ester carboxylesterase
MRIKVWTGLVAALWLAAAPARAASPLSFTTVEGAGGVPLNVVETGPANGPAILFVHGMSMSYLAWQAQLDSSLAKRYRLVAFDLRGHGDSGKPWRREDYAGSKVWADDVAAVIAAKHLQRPTLVAWSFGGDVAMDYVRHYGVANLSGIELVGNLGGLVEIKLVRSPAMDLIWAQSALRQSPDILKNIDGFRIAAHGLSPNLTPEQEQIAFLSGMMQTGLVRRALAGPLALENKDLPSAITVPVLVTVGELDLFSPLDAAKAATKALPNASLSVYAGIGHFVSAEASERFDQELAAFVDRTQAAPAPR